MNSSKLKKNICRICLEDNAKLNWNNNIFQFCGVSYKDCYYKYTKLEEKDSHFYPTNLCEKCAVELKNAHVLFEKALESFKILQDFDSNCFDMDMYNGSLPTVKSEIQDTGVVVNDKKRMETEENPNFSVLCASKKRSKSEEGLFESNQIELSEVATVDPTHFIDIHNFKSSVEVPFEDHFGELGDSEATKSLINKRTRRKKTETILLTPLEQNETFDISFNTEKTCKRKQIDASPKDRLIEKTTSDCKNNDNKIKEVELKDETSLENMETIPAKSNKKSREKYLLMCSYCSLKVDGAKRLEKHEATHSENRERTVACPECGLKLYTDVSLNIHMKIHDANRQKNHKCEFCEKAFFNKGALNVHRRIHLGLMIKCKICEKDFFRQVDLDKHLLKHSASPLEKNVGKKKLTAQCQICSKSILTDKLKEHIAIHLNQPQVKCKICDKNFYSRTKCTNHLRRFHLKNLNEYEDFIHYYVDRNKRLSSLMIKQQLVVQTLKE